MMSLKRFSLPVWGIALILCSCQNKDSSDDTSWRVYGGSKKSQHYSSLTQIVTNNVKQLQVAWTYHTGDADIKGSSQIQCNPIVVDGILYGTTPRLKLFAIDAATGVSKWVFDPARKINLMPINFGMNNCRGVTYWQDSDTSGYYIAQGLIYTPLMH